MPTDPRPFELPSPYPAGNPNPPASHTPVRDQHETPRQHTDLPLSLRGNGGSSRRAGHPAEVATLEQLIEKLDGALSTPAAPSLHDADHRAVERWAERAAAGLVSRREALKLVREVERVLAEERRTARQVDYAKERIGQRRALVAERAAGTHWQRRDSGRRAKQPIHVDVDPAAWRRAKVTAAKNGTTIGHYVGTLVRSVADNDLQEGDAHASTAHLFARVDVDKATWETFKARCHNRDVAAARGVGLLVEAAMSGPARTGRHGGSAP